MAVGNDAHIVARCGQSHAANDVKRVQVGCVREVDRRGGLMQERKIESVDVYDVVIGCGFDCRDALKKDVCRGCEGGVAAEVDRLTSREVIPP